MGRATTVACRTATLPCTEKLTPSEISERWRSYRNRIMVITLAPWGIAADWSDRSASGPRSWVTAGTFRAELSSFAQWASRSLTWDSTECATMLAQYIAAHPEVWNEDIGEE